MEAEAEASAVRAARAARIPAAQEEMVRLAAGSVREEAEAERELRPGASMVVLAVMEEAGIWQSFTTEEPDGAFD